MAGVEDAAAAAAIVGAASAGPVMATAMSIVARCANLMMSPPPVCQRQARYLQFTVGYGGERIAPDRIRTDQGLFKLVVAGPGFEPG